ncbi:cytochrome c biogenesis protein CcsA [Psychrobacter sp. VH5]|uniref:cytochrome c biogenesis protein CcsA n=1 Tax=Psychrobacter sp. VH5 TaxID=3423439 RepID=UPI003D65BF2B
MLLGHTGHVHGRSRQGFLTIGVALGSWWNYYEELGWGGWWFWDPVENASFMPWLVGLALLHSYLVAEKRRVFSAWTIILAIFAFALSNLARSWYALESLPQCIRLPLIRRVVWSS